MGWDEYVNQNLRGAGFCYAAIVGTDGTPYAATEGYIVLPDEARFLTGVLTSETLDAVTQDGFRVSGQRYVLVRGELEDDSGTVLVPYIQGRNKDNTAQGVIIMKTEKCLVIGVHDPAYANNISLGTANTEMGKLCDYLLENNH